jgi:hypothetical protein
MAHEQLKNSALPRALSDVFVDLGDLFQKEMKLARAELSAKLSTKLRAGVWLSIAGLFGVVVLLLVAQAAVLGIATFGIAMHWSCLIVAGVVAVVAAAAFFKGRADAREEITPTRTIEQINEDIRVTREQLT